MFGLNPCQSYDLIFGELLSGLSCLWCSSLLAMELLAWGSTLAVALALHLDVT